MRIFALRTLREFWEAGHASSRGSLEAWHADVNRATWHSMADLKRRYPNASVVDAERVVFNIGGNRYRLVVKVWFPGQQVWVKFVGTHAEYDKLDIGRL
jgi:mRNA interferase HigB